MFYSGQSYCVIILGFLCHVCKVCLRMKCRLVAALTHLSILDGV